MSSTVHALTEKIVLADTDEFYLVQSPYAVGDDRRVALSNLRNNFATNTLDAGTLTANAPMTVKQTWNNAAVAFDGFKVDITDTASAAASKPFSVGIGGVERFSVGKSSLNWSDGVQSLSISSVAGFLIFTSSNNIVIFTAQFGVRLANDNAFLALGLAGDAILARDAAGAFAQRNGTDSQTYRLYHTFTDPSNYERLAFQSGAGFFQIAAETAGSGTDNIDLQLIPAGTGLVSFGAFTVNVDAPVTGYVTIKDAAGNTRKLATIA